MKNTLHLMSIAVVALTLAACGSSSTGTGGGTGGTGGSAGGTGGAGGGTGGGTASDAGVTCAGYCSTIQSACLVSTDGGRSNAQYASQADCLGSCKGFPAGASGAMAGNSLACRDYHAGVANGAAGDKALHCPHAGPAGDGACGTNCEGFCAIAASACPNTFADAGVACATACAAFATDGGRYNSALTGGDSFGCRMYHLTVASGSAAAGAMHCQHITPVSSTCN